MNQGSRSRRAKPVMLLLLFVTVALPAQESRQKIGLVLEGGGALGLAHIAVIEWLYEHHVPVDLVAGTSMGGLVGGIYATGRSPQEIQQLIQNVNWDQALSGQLPFRDLSYRRKEDEVAFPTRIEFGLRRGIQLPAGFNAGQEVSFILDHVTLPDNLNLEQQFTRIAGTGRFASLSYSLTEKDGKPGLLVSVLEKSYSPPIVRPLILIDGTNYNQVLFSAGARISFLDFGTFGSELRNDILAGSIYRLASEYYHPFSPSTGWFIAPQIAWTRRSSISTSTTTSTRNTGSASLAEPLMLATPSAPSPRPVSDTNRPISDTHR